MLSIQDLILRSAHLLDGGLRRGGSVAPRASRWKFVTLN